MALASCVSWGGSGSSRSQTATPMGPPPYHAFSRLNLACCDQPCWLIHPVVPLVGCRSPMNGPPSDCPQSMAGRQLLAGLLLAALLSQSVLPCGASAWEANKPAAGSRSGGVKVRKPNRTDPKFCVVIRTYWGHSTSDGGGLRKLLRSFQRQNVSK